MHFAAQSAAAGQVVSQSGMATASGQHSMPPGISVAVRSVT